MNEKQIRDGLAALGLPEPNDWGTGWLETTCPFEPWNHPNGSRASFAVRLEAPNLYVCQSCKEQGRFHGLPASMLGAGEMSPAYEAHLKMLSIRFYEMEEEDAMSPISGMLEDIEVEPTPVDETAIAGMFSPIDKYPDATLYLARRGISKRTADSIGLVYDQRTRRVVFPVRGIGNGPLWGFTGRAVYENPKIKIKDYMGLLKSRQILGADRWVKGKPVVLVEGLFGFAHLIEIGAETVCNVGAIMGSHLSKWQTDIVMGFGETPFLVFDLDDAGDKGIFGTEGKAGAVHMLAQLFPHVPDWPEGKSDPDQLTFEELKEMLLCPPYESLASLDVSGFME